MSAPIPITEPASLIAGDTVRWLKHLPDFLPADGWQLSYQLVNAQHTITIESTPSGDSHLVQASAASSAVQGAKPMSRTRATSVVSGITRQRRPCFRAARPRCRARRAHRP